MKKFIVFALCAIVGLSLMAEEKFDIVYEAASGKTPMQCGISNFGYQTQDPAAPGYLGLQNGVLVLDHNHPNNKWNNLNIRPQNIFDALTIDVKIRLVGDTAAPQFQLSAVLRDDTRKNKKATCFVNFSKTQLNSSRGAKNFAFGDGFRKLRLVISAKNNRFCVYDMDNGGKVIIDNILTGATPEHVENSIRIGDGTSAAEGKVEVEYIKVAYNTTYIPHTDKTVVYEASSGKIPMQCGFINERYQTNNPSAPGYIGLRNGVLFMDHTHQQNRWCNFQYYDAFARLNSMTVDFKIRLVGNNNTPQFQLSGIFHDEKRPQKTAVCTVSFAKDKVQLGQNKPFAFGNGFRSFRMTADLQKNIVRLYDMDNGGEFIGETGLYNGEAGHRAFSVRVGDGASAVEGQVELEYIKIYYNKIMTP